ncbi:unnamed protein product [Dovyalis caffra]|uniref:Cytochrome P450 n=1 Tax=Dovyalis caffra TaxID=77055 RepID=A0AAV1R9X9_9ROSI|nr:unnamed protein product [Dovyalis caffra]
MLKHVRVTETKFLVKDLREESMKGGEHVMVEMNEKFGDLATNIMIARDKESRKVQKALADFFYLLRLFLVSDAVPFLGWLDLVKEYVGKMKRAEREDRWVCLEAG